MKAKIQGLALSFLPETDVTTTEINALPHAERKAHYLANPMPIPSRGPGIIRTIVHLLEKANPERKGKPITKEQIVEKLAVKFPDRDLKKLRTTIHNNVPTCLTVYYGCPVQRVIVGKSGASAYYATTDFTLSEKPAKKKPARKSPAKKKPARKKPETAAA